MKIAAVTEMVNSLEINRFSQKLSPNNDRKTENETSSQVNVEVQSTTVSHSKPGKIKNKNLSKYVLHTSVVLISNYNEKGDRHSVTGY